MSTTISTVENITLVTLQGTPAKIDFIADVFERIASRKINVDMISMSPTHAEVTELSFTISDDDLIETLALTSELKAELSINAIVSSVNRKILVYDAQMKNAYGVASRVFTSIKATDADLRLITTSDTEVSLLVSEADFDTVLKALQTEFK